MIIGLAALKAIEIGDKFKKKTTTSVKSDSV